LSAPQRCLPAGVREPARPQTEWRLAASEQLKRRDGVGPRLLGLALCLCLTLALGLLPRSRWAGRTSMTTSDSARARRCRSQREMRSGETR